MSSPPDSVGLVSGLDSNNLLQDLVRWSGGVQSGHVSEQHVTKCMLRANGSGHTLLARHGR